jgi:hypothetical protein
MTYVFRCDVCGERAEQSAREPVPWCIHRELAIVRPIEPMRRDYRAENVAPQVVQLKREREAGGSSAVRDLFLPKAKDFESPSDPDGEKGLRAWADETKPKDGNKKPNWPAMKKKVHAVGGK